MRLLIQVADGARVEVDGAEVGAIGRGYVVFVGVCDSDTEEMADKMLAKLLKLRILPDSDGKTNLSITDTSGELLIVSQFTLYADATHGNRPNFLRAGSPRHAEEIYDYFTAQAKESGLKVATGEFGADMRVSLTNDGPFTIFLDSDEIIKK